MKLYRLEETRKPTTKRPWQWRACVLDGRGWRPTGGCSSKDGFSQSRDLYTNWRNNMLGRALQMGTDSESKAGFYCTYYLVRELWPEQVIEELVAKVEGLESEVRGLLAREDG